MRIERRLFIDVKSHWSYVCVLCEKLILSGWQVIMRPELNAVDIIKFSYDGYSIEDNMSEILSNMGSQWGFVRSIYDLNDPTRIIRTME